MAWQSWSRETQIAWLAGILDGEGSFTLGAKGYRKDGSGPRQIRITCGMTDLDLIQRIHAVSGIGNVGQPRVDERRPGSKTLWTWHASARRDVVSLLRELRPFMGDRRGAKIDELLQYAEDNPLKQERRLVHGTRLGYRYYKCRCTECKDAAAQYARELRRRKKNA